MSKLVVDEKNGRIQDAYFAYVRLQQPTLKYKTKTGEKEYTVDVVVDEDTADAVETLGKKVKSVKTEEFEEKYKFAAPFEGKKQYVVKIKTNSSFMRNGEVVEKDYSSNLRPKVYVPVENGVVKDVTMDVRVGNGSIGDVAFNVVEMEEGKQLYLQGILVKDMVALENYQASPFGNVVEEHSYEEEDQEVPF